MNNSDGQHYHDKYAMPILFKKMSNRDMEIENSLKFIL